MPRPRINPKMHRKNVALTLDPQTLEDAMKQCTTQGYSLSATVDALLTDWLVACKTGKSSGPKWKTIGLATMLASIDDQWRRDMGYTGRPVRKSAYWINMAKRLSNNGTLATQPAKEDSDSKN